MSKERELLQRLVDSGVLGGYSFIAEVKELLAQPEQDEYLTEFDRELLKEATATLCKVEKALKSKDICNENLRLMVGDALCNIFGMMSYKGSPPKREPLSYSRTADLFHANKKATNAVCYWAGIDDAEKAHGIGDG